MQSNHVLSRAVLAPLKINIHTAISGKQALIEISKYRFFLILMDVQMPEMDGLETVSFIREHEHYKNTPIIFITAKRDKKHIHQGYEKGAVDYLFKPIDPYELRCKVQAFRDLYIIQQQLQQANIELKMYDRMVAHDLKNPLANVYTLLTLLQDNGQERLNELDQEILQSAIESSNRANRLITDLLKFTEADKPDELMIEINIKQCIEDVVKHIDSTLKEKNTELVIENLDHCVIGVPIKLQQLFQNLIANAVKYQEPNSTPKIRIFGQTNPDSKHQEIVIADNGIGFPQEKAELIFSPFKRLHRKSHYRGSGIGLATCKKIVEFHQWTIRANSREGHGSEFIITLLEAPKAR